MVVIFKAGSRDKGEEEWLRVSSIPMASLDTIKSWLDEIADITFSESTTTYAWKSVLEDVVRKEDFYLSEGALAATVAMGGGGGGWVASDTAADASAPPRARAHLPAPHSPAATCSPALRLVR